MKHKIFISQATLNLGRDRQHRRLEAEIDNLSRTSTIPKKLIRDPQDQQGPQIDCPHYSHCNVKNFGRINCITDYKNCQTYKFYEKYGDGYSQMFVGSRI